MGPAAGPRVSDVFDEYDRHHDPDADGDEKSMGFIGGAERGIACETASRLIAAR
jgi:hypothetical protein